MMIENISNMSMYQTIDVKAEKKPETEDVRSIEGSEAGQDVKLDINKEKVAKNQTEQNPREEPNLVAYDSKGNALDDPQPPADGGIMDLVA